MSTSSPPVGPERAVGEPKLWALLIGIDQYPDIPEAQRLRGSANDVKLIKQVLIEVFGCDPDRIGELVDSQATRSEILRALSSLALKVSPGDIVVIYYSGHGTQVKVDFASGYSEEREGIVPYDPVEGEKNPTIIDLEIRDRLEGLLTVISEVTLILDTCFSGGGFRDFGEDDDSLGGSRFRKLDHLPPVFYQDQSRPDSQGNMTSRDSYRKDWHSESHVLLAACDIRQSAKEIALGGGFCCGLFTSRLCLTLRQAVEGMTYWDIMEQTYVSVVEQRSQQKPQLKGPGDRKLFGGIAIERAPEARILGRKGSRVELPLGLAEGTRKGAPYLVYAPSGSHSRTLIGKCQVSSVGTRRSWARIVDEAPQNPISPTCFAQDLMGELARSHAPRLRAPTWLRRTVKSLASCQSLQGKIEIKVQRQTSLSSWSRVDANQQGEYVFYHGDGLGLTVGNQSEYPLHINILSLGLKDDLYRPRALLGIEPALDPGSELAMGHPPEPAIKLYVPNDFLEHRGLETYFVLASTRSVPWWIWCLDEDEHDNAPTAAAAYFKESGDRWAVLPIPIRLCRGKKSRRAGE